MDRVKSRQPANGNC